MSKHTPGPWEIHGKLPPNQTECEDFDAHTVTIGRGDLMIAGSFAYKFKDGVEYRGYPRVSDFEENVCNARLIAAAPELLEALEATHALLQVTLIIMQDKEASAIAKDQLGKNRAAIAKATGVEP